MSEKPTIKLQNFYKKQGNDGIESMEIERNEVIETPVKLFGQENNEIEKKASSNENFDGVLDKDYKEEKNITSETKKEDVIEKSEDDNEKELTMDEIAEEKRIEEHIIKMLKNDITEDKGDNEPKTTQITQHQPLRLGRDGTPNINSGKTPSFSQTIGQPQFQSSNTGKTLNNSPFYPKNDEGSVNIIRDNKNENLVPQDVELRPVPLESKVPSQQISIGENGGMSREKNNALNSETPLRHIPLGGNFNQKNALVRERPTPNNQLSTAYQNKENKIQQNRQGTFAPIRLRSNTEGQSNDKEGNHQPNGANIINREERNSLIGKLSESENNKEGLSSLKIQNGGSGVFQKEPRNIDVVQKDDDKIGIVLDSEKKVRNGWTITTWIGVVLLFMPTLFVLGNNFINAILMFFKNTNISNMMVFFSGILSILSFIILLFAPIGKIRSPLSFLINRFGLLGEELKKNENKQSVYMNMFINIVYILFILASYIFFIKGYLDPKSGFTTIFNASIKIFVAYSVVWVSTLVIVQILSVDKSKGSEGSKTLQRNLYAVLLILGIVCVLMFYPIVIENIIGWLYQNDTLSKIFDFLGYEKGASVIDISIKK